MVTYYKTRQCKHLRPSSNTCIFPLSLTYKTNIRYFSFSLVWMRGRCQSGLRGRDLSNEFETSSPPRRHGPLNEWLNLEKEIRKRKAFFPEKQEQVGKQWFVECLHNHHLVQDIKGTLSSLLSLVIEVHCLGPWGIRCLVLHSLFPDGFSMSSVYPWQSSCSFVCSTSGFWLSLILCC